MATPRRGSFNGCTMGFVEDEHEVVYERRTHTREEALAEVSTEWGVPVIITRTARARNMSRVEMWRASYAFDEYDEWRKDQLDNDPDVDLPATRPSRPPKCWDPFDDEHQSCWRFAKWWERGVRIWVVGESVNG